ncbi:ras opposite [Amanita rubescens]|nr:ras opposite [Amanita rubescens]
MSSLLTTVRNKFLDAIRSVNPPGKWKILVIDEHSQRLLQSVLKQFDILEENVTLIESISKRRDPQPDFEAVYLLMPTTQNVDRVIRDFGQRKQYAAAHLFFIEGLSATLFERLTSSSAEPHLKGLKELYINFSVLEAQTWSIQMPELFFSAYSPPRNEQQIRATRVRLLEDLQFASKMISNLCITLNEFPFIRYYVPQNHKPLGPLTPHASIRAPPPAPNSARWRTNLARGSEARAWEAAETDYVTKLLAHMVQQNLDEHKKLDPDFAKTPETIRPRGTLIITDRSMDMFAPFIHEFTYQAMAHDLLPIDNGKYTYKFQSSAGAFEDKTATLSDADNVWTEVRHLHMREAIDKLMADFNKFLTENAVFKGEGAANLNDMKEMLANLPQYQEQREKFSLHLNMAQECMDIFERDKLPVIGNVEQCCATGLTAEGKSPKSLVEEMVPLIDSREVINANKVRVVALYIQYRDGVPDEDKRRLYQHARLNISEQDAVNSLVHMGVRITRTATDRETKKRKQKPISEDEYELSRFKPTLRGMLEDHVAGKLDKVEFPYVREAPSMIPLPATARPAPSPTTSLRSQKPAWHRAAKPGATSVEIRQRVMVFVFGGMTYSEIREAYLLSTALNKDIYIGSTHTLTPRQFVDDLKVLELAGVGSRDTPNGLRDPKEEERPLQEYYDEKYFCKEAPAAPVAPPIKVSASRGSANSSTPPPDVSSLHSAASVDEKKKKKKGFFRF